jgi:aspartyl-tRNA(Asn)/glutamyl-tRNA(Gln) amidotransferase subunit C
MYTAELANLNISRERAVQLTSEMESIIGFADMLSEIEFDDVEANANRLQNVFRDDVVTNENRRDEMLMNTPKTKEGCYLVPNVIQ